MNRHHLHPTNATVESQYETYAMPIGNPLDVFSGSSVTTVGHHTKRVVEAPIEEAR